MKINIYKIFLFSCVLFATACYKDKGNYDFSTLEDFYVDTAGIQSQFLINQYDTLRLPSRLIYKGDKAKLKYSWTAYLTDASGSSRNPADTLALTENIAVPIGLLPETYWLQFTAENTETGRRTTFRYTMQVEGVGSGMMVLYEKEGHVDCDLIKTRLLEGLLPEDIVVRGLYSVANPTHPLTGHAVGIGMFRSITSQFVRLFTDKEGVTLSPADMGITGDFNSMFSAVPDVSAPQSYYVPAGIFSTDYENSTGFEMVVNGGQLYVNMVLFGFGKPTALSLMLDGTGDYEAAPWPRYGSGRIVMYDQKNMRFLGASPLGVSLSTLTGSGTAFNFQNVGKKMLYMNYGYGGTYMNYGFFKDPVENGKRYLYVFDLASNTARYAWDISSYDNIAQATIFATGSRGQLAYYAAGNKVYQIKFDFARGELNGVSDAWPFIPAGEQITFMKLSTHPGRNVSENAIEKYLFVATYNESEKKGKVYMLQTNVTSGTLQQQPAAVFENFGKIKDISFKY